MRFLLSVTCLLSSVCLQIRAEEPPPASPFDGEKIAAIAAEKIAPAEFAGEIPRLIKVLEKDPENCNEWSHLAWCHLAAGQCREASAAIEASLRIRPYNARHLLVQAYCEMAQGRAEKLIQLLARAEQSSVFPFNHITPKDMNLALSMISDQHMRDDLVAEKKKCLQTNTFALDRSRAGILAEAEKVAHVRRTGRERLNRHHLWVALEGRFLRIFDEDTGEFEDLAPAAPEGFANANVTHLLFLLNQVLAVADGVLLSCDLQQKTWTRIASPEGVGDEKVSDLCENDADSVMVRFSGVRFQLHPATGDWKKITVKSTAHQQLQDDPAAFAFARSRFADIEALTVEQAESALSQFHDLEKFLKTNAPDLPPECVINPDGKLSVNELEKMASKAGAGDDPPIDCFRGMTLPAWHVHDFVQPGAAQAVKDIAKAGANWISIVSTAYQNDPFSTDVAPDPEKTPTLESVRAMIRAAHDAGLKVLLKTHVNLQIEEKDNHIWRGMIALRSEAEIKEWFANYEKFMMDYVDLGVSENVEMMTVGVELRNLTKHVAQWKALIEAIRQRGYTGKLTFAALHEDYDKVEFWDALDYIGIDAYFELTRKNAPPLADVIAGTNKLAAKMAAFSEVVKKPIVFTEIGYNNLAGTAFKPWYWSGNAAKLDNIEQAACYHAMLAVMSRQKWLAGMFWWTWYPGGAPRAGEPSYSPQSKLAELILESYYGAER